MKDAVRERYAEHARNLTDEPDGTPPTLGVGDPVTLAALQPGETVLDLGSGPGRDLFAAAHAVGPLGRAIGVDMTPEMIERSRAAAPANASVVEGDLERLPLPCASVDVVISNCVINLVPDKRRALVEAYRVLTPGGRLAVVDTAFDTEPDPDVRADADSWSCCVGGALVAHEYVRILEDIGFTDVALTEQDASCGEICSADGTTVRSVAVTAAKAGARPVNPPRPAVTADREWIEPLLQRAGLPTDGFRVEDTVVIGKRGAVAVERQGTAALLRSLVVDPQHRREGLGTRLAFAALEVARWSGAEEVYLLTTDAQGFFERIGFLPVSRKRAQAACPSAEFDGPECAEAVAMRLYFEDSDLPLLGKPSRKELPTFQSGACC